MITNRRLRIGVSGAGHIAQAHIAAFRLHPQICEVVSVCDVDIDRAQSTAARYGIERYHAEYNEMLGSETLDCVVVCTPTYLHCSQTIAALRQGASVLCEKPMAMTVDEAMRMEQAATDAGRVLYIGFNHRFYDKFTKAKEVLTTVDHGRLTSMVAAIGHGGWQNHDGTWFTQQALSGGGAFMTCGIHLIDMLLWYGFKISSVSGMMRRNYLTGDCEDDGLALLNFKDGGIGSLHASYAWRHPYAQHLRMNFERLTMDIRDDDIIITREGQNEAERLECADADSFQSQATAFLAAVQGECPPFVGPQAGIDALRIVLAAYASNLSAARLTTVA